MMPPSRCSIRLRNDSASTWPEPTAALSSGAKTDQMPVLGQIAVEESRENHDDSPGYAATESGDDGITLDRKKGSMNFAYLDVRYPGSRARWHKSSCHDRNHFMVLIGKALPGPSRPRIGLSPI